MTRKQALHKAIAALSDNPDFSDTVEQLESISKELPLTHWTDSSIKDATAQFIAEFGRVPAATDFKRKGMPPHTVIRRHYGVTLAKWLKANYPAKKPTAEALRKAYTEIFIEEYNRIKPKSQREFNRARSPAAKGWQTVAQYNGVTSWRKLLGALKLQPYYELRQDREKHEITVHMFNDYDFRD